MLLAMVLSRACSSVDRSLPVNTTTGTSTQLGLGVHLLQQVEARHVGQAQVQHHAVEGLVGQCRQRLAAGAGRHDVDVVVAQQLDNGLLLDLVVLDHQQSLACAVR